MTPERDVLFVAPFRMPFIDDDIESLRRHYRVHVQIGHGLPAAVKIAGKLFMADAAVCWFASVYAFIAVAVGNLLGVKTLVVAGGVDVARIPELGYGIWLSPWRARLVRYVFRRAYRILVVAPFMADDAKKLAEYDGENIVHVPTGYDPDFWKPVGGKDQQVLTVAMVRDRNTAVLKGLDTLVEAAWKMPTVNFTVIGVEPRVGLRLRPPMNMKFYAPMPRADILPFYQRAKVYCHPSRREGLPNALCEAMLCGCIPVATQIDGNAAAMGTTGFLVPVGEAEALMMTVHQALTTEEPLGVEARARIVSLFPNVKREQALTHLLETAFP